MSVYHKGVKIVDFYKFEDELGRYQFSFFTLHRGSFAIVRSATNRKTGEKVAIKIIERYYKLKSLRGL